MHAGDVLFTIHKQRYALALSEARANLNNLEQQRAEAKAANAWRQKLGDYASQEDRDDARFAYSSAQAQVEQAEVAVEQAKLDLERATVRAPVDGCVTNLPLRPGEYVSPARTPGPWSMPAAFTCSAISRKPSSTSTSAPRRASSCSPATRRSGASRRHIARGISDKSPTAKARTGERQHLLRLGPALAAHPRAHRPRRCPRGHRPAAGLTATVYLNDTRSEHRQALDWQRTLTRWWESLVSI